MKQLTKRFFLASLIVLFILLSSLSFTFAGTLPTGFTETNVVTGLTSPVGMAFLPDGRILVIEQAGTIKLVSSGTASTLLTVTGITTGGERGLLGIAVDPDYPTRPYIYVYYTAATSPNYAQVARYTFSNNTIDPNSKLILINDIPDNASNHNGGTLRFGLDKTLYISVGDDASSCDAQNRTLLKGNILRIKVDDTINPADRATLAPANNPFVGSANNNEKIVWAYGLRNPFRFNVHPDTGALFIGDVGLSTREEIDISTGGENFGWPYWEGNVTGPSTNCGGVSGTMPIYDYTRGASASVIGGVVYKGVNYPNDASLPAEFNGNFFFNDYYTGNLRVLRWNGSIWNLVAGVDATNFGTGYSYVSDWAVGPDGAIYYVYQGSSRIVRIAYSCNNCSGGGGGDTGNSGGGSTSSGGSGCGIIKKPNDKSTGSGLKAIDIGIASLLLLMLFYKLRKLYKVNFWIVFVFFIITITIAINAEAATLEVGTGKTYSTIQTAANAANAGDTILVFPGTYNERVTLPSGKTGTLGNKIIFKSQTSRAAFMNGFDTGNANYLRIEGFDIFYNVGGWYGGGIWINNSSYVDIVDNYFHDIPGQAINPNWSSGVTHNNIYVANNKIYRVNQGIIARGNDWLVENNDIERLVGTFYDADYTRFFGENITFRNNYFHGTFQNEIGTSHTDGFQTFAVNPGEYAKNIIIEGNVVRDFYHQGLMLEGKTGTHDNFIVRNNIFADAASWGIAAHGIANLQVLNNNFVNMLIHGVGFRAASDGTPTTGVVQNNIFYNGGTNYWKETTCTGCALTGGYNIITIEKYPYYKESTDLIGVDPLFVNASGYDFHLQSGSPAIDAGTSSVAAVVTTDIEGNTRPIGAGYDIGAYEMADPNALSVQITSPTTGNTYPSSGTYTGDLALSGTATPASGRSISSVSCTNGNGGSCVCSGTTNWTCNTSISSGQTNINITVKAIDNNNSSGIDVLVVNPSSGGGNGGDTGGNTGGGDASSSGGGSGCGFVKDNGKGQKAKGEGLALMIMLIITLAGIALVKRIRFLNKILFFTIAILLFHSSIANAWTVNATWEKFNIGDNGGDNNLGSGDGIWVGGNRTSVQSTYAHLGTKSLRFYFQQGVESTGIWEWHMPTNIYDGGELWARFYLYAPVGFDWTANPITKIFRVPAVRPEQTAIGNISILATRPSNYECSGSPNNFGYIVGGADSDIYRPNVCQNKNTEALNYLTTGKWHALELYIRVSSSGNGIYRIWHDGELIWEHTGFSNIPPGGYLYNGAGGVTPESPPHFLGWWNGGPSQDQYFYIDDFSYTNERPSNQDAEGNYMIGPTDWQSGGGGGSTPPPSSSSGGDSSASGGSGCGFVKNDGKGQKAKGEVVAFMLMLIITLAGVALAKKIFRVKGFILYKYISVFLIIIFVILLNNNYLNAENTDRTKAEAACQGTDVILCENWEDGDSVGWMDFSTTASSGGPIWGGISCLIGNCTYQNAGYNSNSALEAYLTAPNNNGTIYPSHNIAGLGVDDGVYIRWKAYWSSGFEWNTNGNKHLFVWMGAGPTNTQIQEAGFFFRPLHDDPSLGYLTGNVPIENIKFARPGIHQYCAGTDAIQRPEWATICNNVGGDVWYMPNVQGHEMFTVASGRWYDFELYLRPNPLGQSFGGAIKLWVDGTLITDYTDVSLRHANTNAFIDQVELSSYWGGGGVYPTHPDQYVLYDNIIVSKSCIGCSGSGGDTSPPSSGSGGDSGGRSSGGGGCGYIKDDNGKGQKAKGEGVTFAIMLIIALTGIALAKRKVKT